MAHRPAAFLFVASLAYAGSASAYDSHGCIAKQKADDAHLNRGTAGVITNSSADSIVVFCPVVKNNSGPGVINDRVLGATVPFQGTSSLSCDLQTFVVGAPAIFGGSNWVESFSGNATTSPLVIDASWSSTPQGFWDGYGGLWYYEDLRCELPAGAGLKDYTISEEGTDHGYRIYPPDQCTPNGSMTANWRYLDFFGGGETLGGAVYADASAGTNKLFRFDCPVPQNSRIDFSVGPAYTGQTLGCSYDTAASPQTWPSQSVGSNTNVYQYLPRSASTYMFIPSGSHKLVCDIAPATGNGDGRLDSYRSSPGASATGTPTGGGSSASNALDYKLSTRWTTGTAQANGQAFVVNLGAPLSFNKIKMDSNGSNDYAHGYQVFVSSNGSTWGSAIATGTGSSSVITVTFPTQTKQYVKVVQTASDPAHWWSIHEFSVYKN